MRTILAVAVAVAIGATSAALAGQYPSYIRSHYPKDIQPLLIEESKLDDQCRGTDQDIDGPICKRRDAVDRQIAARGWCWGPDEAIEADRTWMRSGPTCHND